MAVGLPDIIVCVDGHFLGLEVKMPGKQSTFKKAQKLRADQIRAAGGWSEVVTSVEQALDLVFQLREKRHQHLHPGD